MSYSSYYHPNSNNIENIIQQYNLVLNENNSLKQEMIAINTALKERDEQVELLLKKNMLLIQKTKMDEKEYLKTINLLKDETKKNAIELGICNSTIEDQNKLILEKTEIIFRLENASENEKLSETQEKIKRGNQKRHEVATNDYIQMLNNKEKEYEELLKQYQEFKIYHEQEFSKLNQDLNDHQINISGKEKEILELKKDNESLKISIEERNDALANLKNDLKSLTEKNISLEDFYSASLKDSEILTRELNVLKGENNELKKKNDEYLTEEEKLKINLQILKKDNENLRSKTKSETKQSNEFTSDMNFIDEYKKENFNLVQEIEEKNHEILVKTQEVSKNQERINCLEQFTESLQTEIKAKTEKLRKLETDLEKISLNVFNSQNQIDHLTSILGDKQSELLETIMIKDNLSINNKELKDQLFAKNEEIEKSFLILNEQMSEIQNFRHQIDDLNEKILAKNKETSSSQERITYLEEYAENIQREIQIKTEKLGQIEKELIASFLNLRDSQNQLENLTSLLMTKDNELKETINIKDDLFLQNNQLQNEVKNLSHHIEDLKHSNLKLKEQYEAKKREFEDFITESSNMGQELIDLKEELNITKDRLYSKEKELDISNQKQNELLANSAKERNKLEEEKQRIIEKLDQKNFKNQEKSERITDLENTLLIKESEIKEIGSKNGFLTSEIESISKNSNDLSSELQNFRIILQNKESEISTIRAEHSALLEKQLIDFKEAIERKDEEIVRLKNAYNSLLIENEKMNDNNNLLSNHLKNRDIQIENLNSQSHSLENGGGIKSEEAKQIHESLVEIVDKKYLHYDKEFEFSEEKESEYEIIQKNEANQKRNSYSLDIIENSIREFIKMKERNDEVQINEKLEEEMFKILEERNQIITNLKKKIEEQNVELKEKEVEKSKYKERLELKSENIKSYKQMVEERDAEIEKMQARLEKIKAKFSPSPKKK